MGSAATQSPGPAPAGASRPRMYCRRRGPQASLAPEPAAAAAPEALPLRRVPHSHRASASRTHGAEPAAYRAARDECLRGGFIAVTPTGRDRARELSGARHALTLSAYFVGGNGRCPARRAGGQRRWCDDALEIYDTINIGVATAIEGSGLLVPVLRAVESSTSLPHRAGLDALVSAARAKGSRRPTCAAAPSRSPITA